ncbi:14019_t:CDS:2 [Funneliformis mosseae]|uniref:14019_t:CDS:1 n=1 Tax=Funneliformis mosseae TaxID=27381 RepID=A0A9N8UXB7_FUNMO|nr:14019_t:CDS:2 [Funneliformis mosseae]
MEPYAGINVVLEYFKTNDRETWTYKHFLNEIRETIIISPPYSDDWSGLDGCMDENDKRQKMKPFFQEIILERVKRDTEKNYVIEGVKVINETRFRSSDEVIFIVNKRYHEDQERYEGDSESRDDSYISSDDSSQDNKYESPTPYSPENPFVDDAEDENDVITNVPLSFTPLESLESDLFVNGVNISDKFRTFINEAILHANEKGLYVESHIHEILSLSSILVLIPNSYPIKMVEVFGLDLLELTHQKYTPKLTLRLDIEIENLYRSVIKTCLDESRINGIKLLCRKLVEKSEMMDNFGFLIQDLIRTLPYEKIRNDPSELTLITNYLDSIMKNAFHVPDNHIVQWSNTTLSESKVTKFDGLRAKQPDFVVSVNYQSQSANVIYVGEVTGPAEKNNVFKNRLDLIRIGIFMKDCVDSAISRKAEIKILGFQCIGYKIDFYVLDLKGDGIYAMNYIEQISVPATIRDLFTLIDELYVLLNIRSILLESYDTFISNLKNPGLCPLKTKSSFKRKTLDTPKFNKLVSKTRNVKGNVYYA